jgi:E3 ubiquitin-protein ligase makorin
VLGWCHQVEANSRRQADKEVECAICLESVLGKPAGEGARRFGLLACPHAFCLSCIRNWRASDAADRDSAVRTCPVCRTTSHFVTPSAVWPRSPEEKEEILAAYKAKLGETDCMHFSYGDGRCPFGTSCFYRHAYRDGTLEVRQLRLAGNADGGVQVIGPVSLASFLDTPAAQRLLSGGSRGSRRR